MPAQKYIEIYRFLRKSIEEGKYPPETCIPTEYSLVERFHCSRNTVRRAIQQLQEIGYVHSIHGKGVVVIYHKELDQEHLEMLSFPNSSVGGNSASSEAVVLELRHYYAGEPEVIMGFRKDQRVCHVKRLRIEDGTATSLECGWFTEEAVKGITTEIAQNSIYEYIHGVIGERIVSSKRQLTVEVATEDDLKYLDPSPSNSLGVITNRSYNADGAMIVYSQLRKIPQFFSYSSIARENRIDS